MGALGSEGMPQPKTLLAGGPAPQPWSKETLKRFQLSINLVHRRLEMADDPDFRDEGGEHQYGWVLLEDVVLDACGIDMDKLRAAQSTKSTAREDAGCVETSIRLLESIRDLCLMVRSKAHVKLAKQYSDICDAPTVTAGFRDIPSGTIQLSPDGEVKVNLIEIERPNFATVVSVGDCQMCVWVTAGNIASASKATPIRPHAIWTARAPKISVTPWKSSWRPSASSLQ